MKNRDDNMPYMKFYPDRWRRGDVSLFGATEQGVYLNLCIESWYANGRFTINPVVFSQRVKIDQQKLKEIIDSFIACEILETDENGFYSIKFIQDQITELLNKRNVYSKNRKGKHNKQEQLITIDNNCSTIETVCQSKQQQTESIDNNCSTNENKTTTIVNGLAREQEKEQEQDKEEDICAIAPQSDAWGKWSNERFIEQTIKENEKYQLPLQEVERFNSYWLEPSKTGIPRYKLEKTWKTSLRLKNWLDRYEARQKQQSPNDKLAVGQKHFEADLPNWRAV